MLSSMQKYRKSSNECIIIPHAPLSEYCTMKVGGRAKVLIKALSTHIIIKICRYCISHRIKFKIIGQGANLIFSDNGYDGIIIVNCSDKLLFRKNHVYIDSGVSISSLITLAKTKNLGGIENLAGIPSSVGGAVVNSLSAWNTNFTDYIEYVECYHISDLDHKLKLTNEQCKFGYRSSIFKSNEYIITRVKICLNHACQSIIQTNIISALSRKSSSQPLDLPSAGSVFKRDQDIIPALIIDKLGLKGTTIGGAMISTKHAGFIVNTGNSTAENILDLVNLVRRKVKYAYDIDLSPEIEFVD